MKSLTDDAVHKGRRDLEKYQDTPRVGVIA